MKMCRLIIHLEPQYKNHSQRWVLRLEMYSLSSCIASVVNFKQCWESCVTVRPHDTGPGPILVSRSCSDCNLMFKSRICVISVLTTFKVGSGSVDNQKVHG